MSEEGDTPTPAGDGTPVVRLRDVGLNYGKVRALEDITLDVPAGRIVGVIGPDGVGKSSLFALVAGARAIQRGTIEVLGGDMASARHRRAVCPRIAYMPQGLGKNLYPTLSVAENVDFFGRLFGHGRAERDARSRALLEATGLAPFADRPAGKLSGGMKQKLGLCCALIHDPDLLILDEPTTGVDPLSRRQFWELVERIRAQRPGMSVIVATAYMEEAARFDWLVAMNDGRVLATGTPAELLARTGTDTTEAAFIALLPEAVRAGHRAVVIAPREPGGAGEVAIEAHDLTMRFGRFTAVDHVSFRIGRGEIFGFLGSNGCGKTTTMKMLTGLLPASEGHAQLFGKPVRARDLDTRRRVGYMSQSFSLYSELTVRQNLELHARLFGMPAAAIGARVAEMAARFELAEIMDAVPHALPLGGRQRLSLAVAMIHAPEMLILDEPTSGVDPLARDAFWRVLLELARRDNVTIFISTHFMNEAERCDRISLMHAGRVLVSDTPAAIVAGRGAANLEDAFISHLEEALAERTAGGEGATDGPTRRSGAPAAIFGRRQNLRAHATTQPIGPRAALLQVARALAAIVGRSPEEQGDAETKRRSGVLAAIFRGHQNDPAAKTAAPRRSGAPAAINEPLQTSVSAQPRATVPSLRRLFSYTLRESLELRRDPVRLALAALGTVLLMLVLGYGINMDVEDLSFAVLDRDQTTVSRDYALNLSGSRYFIEQPPLVDDDDLDRRMRAGEISLALEIPPGFAANLAHGRQVEVGAWIDGAMPARAETVRSYVQGMHQHWLAARARQNDAPPPAATLVETRFRYNPEVKSLPAMVPAVIPLLLLLIPAVLTAMSVVREKELGSIVNLYVTPVTRLEFLLGKQIPYVALAMFNFLLLTALAVFLFDVPLKGSFVTLAAAALLYVMAATAFGLLVSTFVNSQVAALFGAGVLGILPAVQFSGLIEPVSSLEGGAALIGGVFPTTHFLTIVRGTFSKGLGFADLQAAFVPLALAAPILVAAGALRLKKQAR